MSEGGDPKQGAFDIATMWVGFFSKNYNSQNHRPIELLTNKAGLKKINKKYQHSAGLLWVLIYDLTGALVHDSIKSLDIANWCIEYLAKYFEIEEGELKHLMADKHGRGEPHVIYQELYLMFDPNYQMPMIRDEEAIKGFHMVAEKIMEKSNIGYLFEHMAELTGSK